MPIISDNVPQEHKERLYNLYMKANKLIYEAVGKNIYENCHNGLDYIDVVPLKKHMYGCCARHPTCGYNTIKLSNNLLNCNDEEIMEVLIHEMLHSFNGSKGHDKFWKWLAEQINKKTNYNVQRIGHIKNFYDDEYKYNIECKKCGFKYNFYRLSKKLLNKLNNNEIKCLSCGSDELKLNTLNSHPTRKRKKEINETTIPRYNLNNKEELMYSEICGCYNCLKIFTPQEIYEWVDESVGPETAVCPYCGSEAVIGDFVGLNIDEEFLKEINYEYSKDKYK